MKSKIMEVFRQYRNQSCNDRNEQESNLSIKEQKGLRKLQKKIKDGSLVILKTDKSGKLTAMEKTKYEKLGLEKNRGDKVLDRIELRQIESKINAQSKFWTNILKSGIEHDHQDRILKSKQSNSQNCAPKYFMYKDHKAEGGL